MVYHCVILGIFSEHFFIEHHQTISSLTLHKKWSFPLRISSNVLVNRECFLKMFWKTVKPRFSNKCKTSNTIILTEGDMIVRNEKLIAHNFNNYFADITKFLKLKKHPNFDGQSLFSITDYFKNNESVIKIKENYNTQENSFSFTVLSKEDIIKVIKSRSSNKASPIEEIPIKILKISIHTYSEKLTIIFDECLMNRKFPTMMICRWTPLTSHNRAEIDHIRLAFFQIRVEDLKRGPSSFHFFVCFDVIRSENQSQCRILIQRGPLGLA